MQVLRPTPEGVGCETKIASPPGDSDAHSSVRTTGLWEVYSKSARTGPTADNIVVIPSHLPARSLHPSPLI